MELCELESLLTMVDRTEAVPRVVVARVQTKGRAEAGRRLIEVIAQRILVTAQCIGVDEVRVYLSPEGKEMRGDRSGTDPDTKTQRNSQRQGDI